MRIKKLIAGMTAAVMLANLGTGAFAESEIGVSAGYTLPMLSAVDEGYLVSLEANSSYEINLANVCGDAALSDIVEIVVVFDGYGTANGSLNYNNSAPVDLGEISSVSGSGNTILYLDKKNIDWSAGNYRLTITHTDGTSIKIKNVMFKNSSGYYVGTLSASELSAISWQDNVLSEPVPLDDWEYSFYTNKDIRLSDFDVIPGEWIKVTCHATDGENGGGMISVNGYDGGFDYTSVPASGEVYVRVTEAMVNNGIAFRGWNVTIDRVQFQSAKTTLDKRTTEKVLFEDSTDLIIDHESEETQEGYEGPRVECGRVDAHEGDIIRVEFAEIGENGGWFWLHDRGWADICEDSFNVYGGLTVTEFTLDATDAKAIRENGLLIDGNNITIKKIVLCSEAERANIKEPLARLNYRGENDRDEYWLNVARHGIDHAVYNSATINISGSGKLEAFYNTYDENGEHKNTIEISGEGSSLTIQNIPDKFCIAPISGKVYIESVVFSDGAESTATIESDFFDDFKAYANLSIPENSLDWSVNAFLTAKELKAAGAKAGDVLKFTAEPVTITPEQGESYTSCCLTAAPLGKKDVSDEGIDPEIGYTYWVLTQEMIDKGITLRGECNITGISLCAKSGETRNPVTETVQKVFVSKPVQFVVENTWQDEEGNNCEDFTTLMFGASEIYNAGDVLRLNYTIDKQDDCFMQIVTSDYEKLNNDLSDKEGIVDIWSGIGCIDIPLTAEDVAKIEKMGFRIFGKGFTLNRAELVSETKVGRTSVLAEVWGKEYIINDPLSFLPANSQVAYVVADVYGCDGWGDISHVSPTNGWIQGHDKNCPRVGIDEWRFDFTEDKPLEAGSKIFIQKYNDSPIYVHEVRFYNSTDEVIFTLGAENADVNVVPFTTLKDGDEFWANSGYFLGEELYAQFDKMVIKTKGSNFVTAGYVASNGEYTEISAANTTLELNKSDLGEDWVKLIAKNGEVNVISITYYDANGEVLKVLDYTNVNENHIPATPFTTLGKGESYRLSPYALLSNEQMADLATIVVETTGDGSSGGAFSWNQWNDAKTDEEGNPDPGYEWTSLGNLNSGDEWRFENFKSFVDNGNPVLSINCWWGDEGVGIAAIRFEDAEGKEIYRIDAENQPKAICAVEPPESEMDSSHNYVVNITGILGKIGSKLTAEDIGKVEVRTLGLGGLNIGRNEMVDEELKWIITDWINAGGVASVDVNLSNKDGSVTIQNWDNENVFELYSVSLYDKNGSLIVTLDASNAYLNSELDPIFDDTTVYDSEHPENEHWAGMPIYPKSILGEDFSKLATVEIESYGDGASSFRSLSGGNNEDRHINCTGWDSFDVALEEDSSVLELFADNGRLLVMTIVFKDADGNILAELTSENFWELNKFSGTNENLLAELTSDNGRFVINSKQLLGDDLAKLDYITVKAKGYGNFGIGWNADYNKWVQTGFDLYADTDGSHTIARLEPNEIPGETHSEILLMNWDGYQSVESVTFYDENDNVLFELSPENAKLNTEAVDCTDYVKFNLYDYPLYEQPENMPDEEYNGNIWFTPVYVTEGTEFYISVVVPADVSDENPATFMVADGIVNCKFGSRDYTGEEREYGYSIFLSEEEANTLRSGLTIEGNNVKVRSVVLGSVDDVTNLEAEPGDSKVTLTWDEVPGADRYIIFQYEDENDEGAIGHSLGYTVDTTYTVEDLENGKEYRFSITADKKELSSQSENAEIVAVTPDVITVKGHSLLLGDDIGVNFYMNIADSVREDITAKIKFTVNGRETVVPVSSATLTSNGYKFTCTVAAAEMNDVIKAQLYVNDEAVGSEFTYSVKTYADYILKNAETYYKVVPLVKAMLNYGAAAEKYFRGSTEMSFINPNVSADELAQYKYTVTDNDSVIDFEGQVVSLKSKVTAKLYFSGKTFAVSDFTVTENGVAVDASRLSLGSDNNGTYLAISDISANKMANVFEVTVGGVTVGNYSVYSYVLGAIDSTTEGLSDVVAALYEYGCAAECFTL